ncbi:MAG TPA: class I SAM-dependent methyltransferase [Verrucomicrobiae bacterium]
MQTNINPNASGVPLADKSTLEEIRVRFDQEVDRFSQLETGQQATLDAPLILELVAQAASTHLRPGDTLLDVGCGAGNFTLRVLQEINPLKCHLVDLSRPMLERAQGRIRAAGVESITTCQTDLRELDVPDNSFDCILAGAVLHHLRDERDWEMAFSRLLGWLKPGGRLYVADLVVFDDPAIQKLMWNRYGRHLESIGGSAYREKVFAYIEKEDSPRSLSFQLELLRQVGFSHGDVLHRNSVAACYFAAK